MANEAVIIELLGNQGDPMSFTIADGVGYEKGSLMKLYDPRTISGGILADQNFAGILAAEKVASDGSTTNSVYTNLVADLYCSTAANVGDYLVMSGANMVKKLLDATILSGVVMRQIVGYALETATANEVIAVRVGGGL